MIEPEFDADGYPTEATLTAIREWPINEWADADALLRYVQRMWHWPKCYTRLPRRSRPWSGGPLEWRWLISTGGWSGNESLIEALQGNDMFWVLAWKSSRRGGHYEFRSRTDTPVVPHG